MSSRTLGAGAPPRRAVGLVATAALHTNPPQIEG